MKFVERRGKILLKKLEKSVDIFKKREYNRKVK